MVGKPERVRYLEQTVCKAFGITTTELNGICRDQEIVDARHTVWYVCRDMLGYGVAKISRWYGRDHTTIMHGTRKVRADEKRKQQLAFMVETACPEVLTENPPVGLDVFTWEW